MQLKIYAVHGYNGYVRYHTFVPAIIFHPPGSFKKRTIYGNSLIIYPDQRKREDYLLKYEIHTKQEFASDPPCEDNPKYNYDLCVDRHIENKARQIYGCTTPFGIDKTNICANQTTAQQVLKMYKNIWYKNNTACKVPCKRYSINPIKLKDQNNTHEPYGYTKVRLYLDDGVVMSEEIFLYSILTMIAEVGGYVGLFLGVSVYQLAELSHYVFKLCAKTQQKY